MKKLLSTWMIQWLLFSLMAFFSLSSSVVEAQTDPDIIFDDSGAAYYIVKKGDTLWDISNKFLNSPWYWPELWKENNQEVPILNPHLIYPGQRIRLYPRDQLSQAVQPPTEMPPPVAPLAEVKAPAPMEEKELPPGSYFEYSLINRVGFIRKEAVPASGRIIEIRGSQKMGSIGDILYIEDAKDDELVLDSGQEYTIYRTSDPIYDEKNQTFVGIQHMLIGTVEILKIEGGYALANVTQIFRPIRRSDLLMPYSKRSPKIPLVDVPAGIHGKIITSEDRTYIFGEYDVAFIDKGKNDGIEPGQELMIFKQEIGDDEQDDRLQVVFSPFDVGSLMVLLTEDTTSTVLITRSNDALQAGALIGSPPVE